MRIAARQAEGSSSGDGSISGSDGGEEQQGGSSSAGPQGEQQQQQQESGSTSSDSSSSSGTDADQGGSSSSSDTAAAGQQGQNSDDSAASEGSTASSSSSSSNQESSSDWDSASSSSSSPTTAGSQGGQGASQMDSSSTSTPTLDTSQDSISSSTTPYTMDQSTTTSSDNDNDPSETASSTSATITEEPATTTETSSSTNSDTGSSTTDVQTSQDTSTSDTFPTSETDSSSSEAGTLTSTDDTSSTSTSSSSEDYSPSTSGTFATFTSTTQSAPSSFVTITSTPSSSSSSAAVSATATDAVSTSTAELDQSPSMATSSGILAALSASSSSNIVLGDQIASTAISNNQVPSSSALDGGSNTDDNGNEDGNSGSKNKDPFLNGAGEGSGQNGKVIGGTVGGIIVAIIIVVVVVWLLGKRRRQKFVKPIVERMHTSGSGYSLPSILNGSGSRSTSAGMTPSTSANSRQGMLAASRRRSRAFSIESASTYDKVDLQTETNQTPHTVHTALPRDHAAMSQFAPLNLMGTKGTDGQLLPAGAGTAPYPYSALRDNTGSDRSHQIGNNGYGSHTYNGVYSTTAVAGPSSSRMKSTKYHQQIPSGSSFGSDYMLDHSTQRVQVGQDGREGYEEANTGMPSAPHAPSPSFHPEYASGALPNRNSFYQSWSNPSPTQELLIPSLVKSDSNHAIKSPFDDDDETDGMDPMPHSPTMVPTLLQRRTTDPFSNKHSLRVINVDHDREPGTPSTITGNTTPIIATPRPKNSQEQNQQEESRPFSNWSSIAPSRASTGTMSDAYSTFHFDSFGAGSSAGNINNGEGRISRADSLDAGRRLRVDTHGNFKRSSSSLEFVTREGEILTPRQVTDVGFFKNA